MIKSDEEFHQTLDHLSQHFSTMSSSEKEKALGAIKTYNIKKARDDFYIFVQLLAPIFMGSAYEDGPHIRVLARELQDLLFCMEKGNPQRKQISMPPRSMKTVISSLFVAWVFGRHPNYKILHMSHTQSLIEDVSGRPIRDLIQTLEYQAIFPRTQIKKDSRSAKRWETTLGGIYFCAGIDGKVAGRGANIVITDDLMADHAAKSKKEREDINRKYVPQIRSRLWRFGSELAIGTRWHVADNLGFLQALDGTTTKPVKGSKRPWKIIKIPAIIDEEGSELLGLPVGSSYWPDTKPIEEIEDLKRSNTPEDWAALYAQSPVIEEGNIFKKSHFKIWNHSEPPGNIKFILVSLDPAFSEKTSADFSAYTVWGIFERTEIVKFGINVGKEIKVNNLILLEANHGRWAFSELFDQITDIKDTYDPDVFVVENKASGLTIIQEMLRRGWAVHGYNPTTDKITRAHAATPILGTGRIHIPKLNFSVELLNECLAFPNYAHDDLVDSLVMAILYLRDTFDVSTNRWVSEQEDESLDGPRPPSRSGSYWGLLTGNI